MICKQNIFLAQMHFFLAKMLNHFHILACLYNWLIKKYVSVLILK